MNLRTLKTAASTFALIIALGTSAHALGLGGLGLGGSGGAGSGSGAGSHGNAGKNARSGGVSVGASVGRRGVNAGASVGGLGVGASVGRGGIGAGVSGPNGGIGASVGAGGISTSSQDGVDAGSLGNGSLSPARIRTLIRQARSPNPVLRREAQRALSAAGVTMSRSRNPVASVDLGGTKADVSLNERAERRGRIADVKVKSGNTVNTRASIGNRKAAPGIGSVAQVDADALDGAAKAGVSVGNRNAKRGNIADVTVGAGDTANARASIGNENVAPGTGTIAQIDAGAADAATADISVGRNAAVSPSGETADGVSADIGLNAAGTPADANVTVARRSFARTAPSVATTADVAVGDAASPTAADVGAEVSVGTAPAALAANARVAAPAAAPTAGPQLASVDVGLGLGDEDGTPAAAGTGIPGTPGTPAQVAGLSPEQRKSLEQRCAPVTQTPEKYAQSVVKLCAGL